MPTPRALAIELTERQQSLLEQIARQRSNPHRLVQRAQIMLLAAAGVDNTAISQQINLHRHQVRKSAKTVASIRGPLGLFGTGRNS